MKKRFGTLPVSKGLNLLKPIADREGLRLNRAKELRLARLLFIAKYLNQI
jgi:hypothetical protein